MQDQSAHESRNGSPVLIARGYRVLLRKMQKKQRYILLPLAMLLAWSLTASAGGDSDWANAGMGAWTDPANWSPAGVPDGNNVTIDNGGTAQLFAAAPPEFGRLLVGENNAGAIEITGGGALASDTFATFGRNAGSAGSLAISGADSSLTLAAGLNLGRVGAATVVVESGGMLESNTSMSMIDTIIAENTGSAGSVTIRGVGSMWQANDDLRIAMPATGAFGSSGGAAELTIAEGGIVQSNGGTLSSGADADATVIVTGVESQWDASGFDIFIGAGSADNSAVLVVEDGGRILARDIVINPNDTQPGNRTVRLGTGSTPGVLDIRRIFGAGSGGGVFEINHDAAEYYLSTDGTATGTPVTLEAGLTVNHTGPGTTVLVGANETNGTINVDAGRIVVDGAFFAGSFFVDPVFNVNSGGTLAGDGQLADVVVEPGGTLAPGRSVGTLITDDLVLNENAILEFELSTPGTIGGGVNDLVEGGRDLTLDGILNISDGTGFGAGTYRVINYSRNLVDNGLVIGTVPAGYSFAIDVATDGEVNLVVSSDGSDVGALLLPEQLSFVNVEAGQSGDPEPLLLSSTGADPLLIQQVVLAGSSADAFQIAQDACTSQSLAQNQSCDLSVTFSPVTPGLKFARVEVETNASDSPHVTPITGFAVTDDSLFADSFE